MASKGTARDEQAQIQEIMKDMLKFTLKEREKKREIETERETERQTERPATLGQPVQSQLPQRQTHSRHVRVGARNTSQ
jgi:hypothetical protein